MQMAMFCNALICEVTDKDAPFKKKIIIIHFNFMVKREMSTRVFVVQNVPADKVTGKILIYRTFFVNYLTHNHLVGVTH